MSHSSSFRPPEKQRRQSGRIKLNIAGHYRFTDSDWQPCQLIDVSVGGLSLEGKFSFYAGDVIEVKFLLDKKPLLCRLHIKNVHGKKAGGIFVDLPQAEQNLIRDYLHQHFFGDKKTI